MATWTNEDGLKVNFNLDASEQYPGGTTTTRGSERELVIIYDSQNPGNLETAGNTDGREPKIPAGARITDANLHITTAFTSGGSATLTIGVAEEDGTAIDADGIDAAIALTAIDAVDDVVQCDGALVGGVVAVDSTTTGGYVYFTPAVAALTAGVAKLVITYQV